MSKKRSPNTSTWACHGTTMGGPEMADENRREKKAKPLELEFIEDVSQKKKAEFESLKIEII